MSLFWSSPSTWPHGARKLGYSAILWFFVTFLSSGIIAAILLGGLPNRAMEKQRLKEHELLDQQLAKRQARPAADPRVVSESTITDEPTIRESA